MNISNWIRVSRKTAGLTQTELGDTLGVTKGNVSAWEAGRHEPSYRQMLKIAKSLRATLPGVQMEIPHWPFRKLDQAAFDGLTSDQMKVIEAGLVAQLNAFHSTNNISSTSKKVAISA